MSNFNNSTRGLEGENEERPPADECPICLDPFTVPCKTNCGHWFCGDCILQCWMHTSVTQPCKCPLCSLPLTNLIPVMSQLVQPDEEVIQKVEYYNCLFAGGVYALFLKVLAFLFFVKKAIRTLMNLETWRCILFVRFLRWLLSFFYVMEDYELFSNGSLGMKKILDVGFSIMLAALFLYNIWQRWELGVLERRLAELQERNSLVDIVEQDGLDDLQQILLNLQAQDA